ncbi:LLM class flavin-dependent oxidoreductase [Nocardia sp. NBC_01009]|uniref:LLM class flavin-dependent oxidoreductase n=1 Tax=Nocardia sp. NBC_01009 TaxID=2975996 RepID=UPI00386759E4|nr:LLM class flavin-dependent oxidoreductase [Nocardia sp. NBC_01009]
MRKPEVGYLLPTRDDVAVGRYDLRALIEQARRAEFLGFDSVWAGDSPVARPRADPLLLLSAIAAVTDRITLGTAVLLPALHSRQSKRCRRCSLEPSRRPPTGSTPTSRLVLATW